MQIESFQIEAAANTQAPLIDARLAAIDRQHNALASVSCFFHRITIG